MNKLSGYTRRCRHCDQSVRCGAGNTVTAHGSVNADDMQVGADATPLGLTENRARSRCGDERRHSPPIPASISDG